MTYAITSCDGPVMLHKGKKGNTSEGQVGFRFLEAHSSSRVMNL